VEEEQVRARDMIVSVEHPTAGRIKLAGLPIKLSETPGAVVSASPLLGEHTHEVLERLGYARSFIDKLISDGIVGVPD
ncbi:MAG: CoA transferase, partial [Betaproteobacteria bacterium]